MSLFERSRGFSHLLVAAAIACVSSAGFVVACGSSDDGSSAADDGGTTSGDGGAGLDGGDPTEGDDGGIFMSHADAGCPVKYAGPNPGTVAVSVPRASATGIPWANPANALTVNGQYARSVVTDGEQTELLRVTGYGFKVPANVTIKGVVVELKRQGEAQRIVDGNIELWLDGVASDRPKFVASGWPVKIGTHHYGQEVDTWGNDLTPELVGRPGFGTEIWAKRREDAGTGPIAAEIESLLITIWYCDP